MFAGLGNLTSRRCKPPGKPPDLKPDVEDPPHVNLSPPKPFVLLNTECNSDVRPTKGPADKPNPEVCPKKGPADLNHEKQNYKVVDLNIASRKSLYALPG